MATISSSGPSPDSASRAASDRGPRKGSGAPSPKPSFLERYAGWIVAACLFVMLFSWLAMKRQAAAALSPHPLLQAPESAALPPAKADDDPQLPLARALNASLDAAAESPSAASSGLAASSGASSSSSPGSEPLASASGAASAGSEEANGFVRVLADAAGTTETDAFNPRAPHPIGVIYALMPPAATLPPELLETPSPAPPSLATPPPAPEPTEAEKTQAFRQAYGETVEALHLRSEQMQAANDQKGREGSGEIASRLNAAQADQTAQKTLYHQPIMKEGVLRTIDLSDADMKRAQEVLDRYGIQIKILDVKRDTRVEPASGGGFLSGINTRSGMFVRPVNLRAGTYQAFTFGQIAEKRMAQLEEEALQQRKLDPAKTRVTRVVFGVVSTGKGYDLGVRTFESAPIAESNPETR